MEKDKLFEYISHPEKLDAASLENLLEVVREFPYFQTARMLLAKNLKNIGHYRYDSELKLTATYAGNRTILYWLINDLGNLNQHLKHSQISNKELIEDFEQGDLDYVNGETQKLTYDLPIFHTGYQIDIGEKKDFNLKDLIHDINESAKQSKKEGKKKAEEQLLDNFIVADPGRIEPAEPVVDDTDHSVADTKAAEGFLSEKLAAIYAKQGHLKKAIAIYNKLADQIPERQEEFLAMIRELEERETD